MYGVPVYHVFYTLGSGFQSPIRPQSLKSWKEREKGGENQEIEMNVNVRKIVDHGLMYSVLSVLLSLLLVDDTIGDSKSIVTLTD